MIYMQAIRFLTDYLNNDVYYSTNYPEYNLLMAQNLFTLLDKYISAEDKLRQIVFSTQNISLK